MRDELEWQLADAYAEYLKRSRNSKSSTEWNYQEWLDNSSIANRIIRENWTPE
jgi:hypothetical protein